MVVELSVLWRGSPEVFVQTARLSLIARNLTSRLCIFEKGRSCLIIPVSIFRSSARACLCIFCFLLHFLAARMELPERIGCCYDHAPGMTDECKSFAVASAVTLEELRSLIHSDLTSRLQQKRETKKGVG